MSDEFLGDRKKALEESFFAKENERLLERMRDEKAKLAAKDALAEASRIQDDAVLDRLVELEIGPDTWTALSLIPLVEVAWADGRMDPREREAILRGATETGIPEGSWSYRLLRIWTVDPPAPELFEVWEEFIGSLAAKLGTEERAEFRRKLVGRSREVAEAAAGLLGTGPRVSESEARVLRRLDEAFEAADA